MAVLGGTVPVITKLLVGDINPVVAEGLAILLSGAIIIPYKPKAFPRGGNALLILGISLTGATLAPILYFTGIQQSTAVNAALLGNGEVLFTALIAFGVFHESLRRRQLAEGLLIAAGVIVVSTNLQSGVSLGQGVAGNVLLVGASFLWSVDNNLTRIASHRLGASVIAKFKGLIGGGITTVFLLLSSSMVVSLGALPLIGVLGAIFACMAVLSAKAFRLIGAVRAILVFSASSILGPLFAFVALGETVSLVQVGGGALILSGVYLIQRSEIPP